MGSSSSEDDGQGDDLGCGGWLVPRPRFGRAVWITRVSDRRRSPRGRELGRGTKLYPSSMNLQLVQLDFVLKIWSHKLSSPKKRRQD